MDLNEIKRKSASGKELEEIIKEEDWKEFEAIVSKIFEENDFSIKRNLRFTEGRRFEIDVVAESFNEVICVDCKKWSSRPGKTTALKYAVRNQIKRVEAFKNHFRIKKEIYPMIVTFLEENISFEENVPIVPAWKLNSFLTNFYELKDSLYNC